MFKHIMLATDGSEASDHAANIAVDLAISNGAKLTVVYVVDPYPYLGIGESNPFGFDAYMSTAQAHGAAAHAKVAALCEKSPTHIEFQAVLLENVAAAHGLVEAAKTEGADLIVIGSHGRSGIMRLMLGSVANRVVAESPIPVLIAR